MTFRNSPMKRAVFISAAAVALSTVLMLGLPGVAVENSSSKQEAGKKEPASEDASKVTAPKIAVGKGKRADITFDDLKFGIEKGQKYKPEMLTDRIKELEGKPVKLRGFMLPSFQQRGITEFILVRDNLECCFGPGAALYDCIVVKLKGITATYSIKPIAVEGVFSVNVMEDPDGNHLAVFQLDGTKVQ
jgi:hypothetical protein